MAKVELREKYLRYFDKEIERNLSVEKSIGVYEFLKGEHKYLKIRDYNRAFKKDRNSLSMYLLLAFGFGILVLGVYLLMINKKPIRS